MKRKLVFTCGAFLLVAGAACAVSEEDRAASASDSGTPLGDGASPDETVDDAAVLGPDGCSAAGWCVTQLPDADLTLKDVWPLPGHAFAIAESPTRGVKVLEWTELDAKWVYIDDNSQNRSTTELYAGRVWAPSADEVYFTVAPRAIYHGKRQNRPGSSWTWAHQQLEDRTPPYATSYGDHYRGRPTFAATKTTYTSLGVFGTGVDDVYAWYANAIYRATKDRDGNESWAVEYVADDRDDDNEQLFFVGASATSKDDVWFAGGRGGPPGQNGCPVLVHKTAAGYRRVADGALGSGSAPDGGGIGFPPPDGGIVLPPPDGGIGFPPPDGGIGFPPPDGGIVLPPPDGGIGFPPPDGGIVLPPPDGGIGFPPPDGGIGFPPPGDGGIGIPPLIDGGIGLPNDGGLGLPIDGGFIPLDGGLFIDGGITLDGGGGIGVGGSSMCKARAGRLLLGAAMGWLGSVEAIAPQRVVLLKGGREVVKVAASGDDYTAEVAELPYKPSNRNFVSLWTAPNDSIWLGGPNIILRGNQDLTDGGTYDVSTIALKGAWLETPIYQIRGSSHVDRWAVGARYALHKTTP
ncbi:MAG: hypothetical protein BGO98_22565 [Myxococcales bacterium 68-20]|nr:hypothetical protein [Myxococcales bacterium]OJY15229.1 MAG: hypothetical protein BGO98_22565 [Myxococcales bacterium 68-20]